MKKALAIILALALCMICFAVPVFANDLNAEVIPGNLERGLVYESSGKGYVYCLFSTGRVAVTITVRGYITLDSNGNVIDFDCLSCNIGTTVLYGSAPPDFAASAHYVSYSISNNKVIASVYYSITGDGIINSGYVNATISGL